eukprot:4779623-Lingulodinium_polyedra.AAC.1
MCTRRCGSRRRTVLGLKLSFIQACPTPRQGRNTDRTKRKTEPTEPNWPIHGQFMANSWPVHG